MQYEKVEPSKERHLYRFSKAEVAEALLNLARKSHSIPSGSLSVWGFDNSPGMKITLVVDPDT